MHKSLIGNPCVGCAKGKTCNKSQYDHLRCKDYVYWKFHYDNFNRLKTYGYKIAMSKWFGLSWMSKNEALRSSDEEFDSWIGSLSEIDLKCHRLYIKEIIEKFYKMGKKKDHNIESVIKKYGFHIHKIGGGEVTSLETS